MCGILGFLGRPDPQRFLAALASIAHRGPDGQGVWRDEFVTLGHRRLAILDVSDRARQPFEALDRYVLVFNGEIYNFKEIRKDLEAAGVPANSFRSESDTEVLLLAYAQWGPDCVTRFNGMWALAIWDRQERSLFLSRDRFGKKPLFYAFVNNQFAFASEMKALFPFLPRVEPSADFSWCKTHLNEYEATDKCLIAGIKRFPAGHNGFLREAADGTSGGNLKLVRYWDTMQNLIDVPSSYPRQVERFHDLFLDATALRMRSDVPIGTALSGGLDSSAVICAMAHLGKTRPDSRMSKDWQHAFVATFPGTFLDESFYAKKVVDHLGIKATFINIDPAAGIENLLEYLRLFEELHLTSPIPMIETYKAVRAAGVKVTLDGHGADESISGYGQDVFLAFRDAGLSLPKIQNILKTYQGLVDIDSTQINKRNYNLRFYMHYMGGPAAFMKFAFNQLLGQNPRERIRGQQTHFGQYNQKLYTLFHHTVLPTLLRNYDRYSMINGVEIRCPFLDHRLVSFLFSLPWTSKVRQGYTKRIVRDALRPYIPPEVVNRTTKIGFNTPIVDWMKGPWRTYLQDTINSQALLTSTLVEGQTVRAKVNEVIADPRATYIQGEQAWAALAPHLWEKAVLRR